MDENRWSEVDDYLNRLYVPEDPVLEAALAASAEAGLPDIQVTPTQGRLLGVLALALGARRILEVGTLGGYSTICLARALPPGGWLVTLELEPRHAEVARANLARAGFGQDVAEVRVGPALDLLPALAAEGGAPFDLVFLDADKPNTPAYFDWAIRLARPGTLIIADNVIRHGEVVDPHSEDERVQGMRRFHAQAGADPRVAATTIQTVGSKGYDGLTLAVVVGDG
jgi:predicted O-methyltransferase YrrM